MALKSRLVQALLRSSTSLGTTQISPAFVLDDVDAFSYFFVGGVATRQFFPYAVNDCLSAANEKIIQCRITRLIRTIYRNPGGGKITTLTYFSSVVCCSTSGLFLLSLFDMYYKTLVQETRFNHSFKMRI